MIVCFIYTGKEISLSEEAEEVAGFYARMLNHDYTTMPIFNKNFFKDWRKVMTSKEQEKIKDLSKCNFKKMHVYYTEQSELRKARSKEEKQVLSISLSWCYNNNMFRFTKYFLNKELVYSNSLSCRKRELMVIVGLS